MMSSCSTNALRLWDVTGACMVMEPLLCMVIEYHACVLWSYVCVMGDVVGSTQMS